MALSKLQSLQDEMKKCFRCSLCKMIPLPAVRNPKYSDGCPASRMFHFHGYSGSGKNIMALSLVDGRIQVDEAMADIAFACTACGLCDVSCKFIMEAERHRVNMALREHIVEEGFGPLTHQKTVENLQKYGSPEGKPPDSPAHWAKELDLKILPGEKVEVLLFAGCLQNADLQSAEVVGKLARLLQHAGVDFGVLGNTEPCCGLPAYWNGYRDVFTTIASDVTAMIDGLGVRVLVAASGSCFGAFRSKYPEYHRAPEAEILHATQLLARLVEDGKLRLTKPVKRKVTYHDPCYLGRESEPPIEWKGEYKISHGCMTYTAPPKPVNRGVKGIFDEPRRLLRSIKGLDFVEMYRVREYAFCCGGGGGVPEAYPELANATAGHRIEEAIDVGADLLVTACHRCRINLLDAQEQTGKDQLPVMDIIDLVYEAADI